MSDSSTLEIQLEFGGGMELLFSSIASRKLTLPRTYDPRILSTQPPPSPPSSTIVSTSTTTSSSSSSSSSSSNKAQVIIDPTSSMMMETERGDQVKRRTNLRYLIWYLRWKVLEDSSRPELFSIGESVRPGILVLINSTDWELEGELDYVIEDGDQILFISTLHGG